MTQSTDFAAAVAAARQYWGPDHDYNDAELFAMARCQWERAKGGNTAARDFVVQVVACRLEEQFLLWLMQVHAADAAEDIQAVVEVCTDVDLMPERMELLSSVLDTLSTAAVVRAAACDRSGENRTRRIAELVQKIDLSAFVGSKTRSVVRVLGAMNEDAGSWTQFLDLPAELETRLFNSRGGRDFMDKARQVVALQQIELREVFQHSGCVQSDEVSPVANTLWTLAEKTVELVSAQANAGIGAQASNGVGLSTNCIGSAFVERETDLEEYLRSKESIASLSATGSLVQEVMASSDDANLYFMEQLTEACSALDAESTISSALLQAVFDELSAVTSLDILSIHASFLISLQMRLKCCFIDRSESAKVEFGRRVRRLFNRLTGKTQELEHAAPLIALAAFCPGHVIRQFVQGARTDVLHHKLYLKILRESPLLLNWSETFGGGATFLECELHQALVDLSSKQSCFDREGQNMTSFLLSLVGISNVVLSKLEEPVLTISRLFSGVLNPLYSIMLSTTHSMEMQLNLYSLIQQLLQEFVTANAGSRIQFAMVENSFGFILLALQSTEFSDPRLGVLIRERLLLLLKNTMELMVEPTALTRQGRLDTPLNPSLWTLIGLFNNELVSDEMCKGLEDVTTIELYLQASPEEKSRATPMYLSKVISAAQVLLWGLLWNSTLSVNASVECTQAETWRLLDIIAGYEFPHTDSTQQTVKGALLIESAVAEVLLECGSTLFRDLYANIIPYLLEYESIETRILPEETIAIPEWAAEKIPDQPEFDLEVSCRLQSTHSTMRYVAKCWGLSCAANTHLATASINILVVGSLSQVLAALDKAATSSEKSLSCTLFCIQWLCVLVSGAYDLRLDAASTWSTVRTQAELLLLRLLHQLFQLKGTQASYARFSQYFLAAWLAYLPIGQFEQVFNFLASRTSN